MYIGMRLSFQFPIVFTDLSFPITWSSTIGVISIGFTTAIQILDQKTHLLSH